MYKLYYLWTYNLAKSEGSAKMWPFLKIAKVTVTVKLKSYTVTLICLQLVKFPIIIHNKLCFLPASYVRWKLDASLFALSM